MKRFYKTVGIKQVGSLLGVTLDGRPLRTPAGEILALRSPQLAEAIAGEWAGQGEGIDQRAMPLTGLANTAVDHVRNDRTHVLGQLETFAKHDLVAHRASEPADLVARETAAWDLPLFWARTRYGLDLKPVTGLALADPSADSLASFQHHLSRRDEFALTGLVTAAGIMKSVVLALSLADGRFTLDEAHAAAHVDETYQSEKWGRDSEAEARLRHLHAELDAAHRFIKLLG